MLYFAASLNTPNRIDKDEKEKKNICRNKEDDEGSEIEKCCSDANFHRPFPTLPVAGCQPIMSPFIQSHISHVSGVSYETTPFYSHCLLHVVAPKEYLFRIHWWKNDALFAFSFKCLFFIIINVCLILNLH